MLAIIHFTERILSYGSDKTYIHLSGHLSVKLTILAIMGANFDHLTKNVIP